MPDPYFLRWKLDRPNVDPSRPEEVHVLITIEPNPTALKLAAPAPPPLHLLLLVDVSGSMDYLVRFDPAAQKVGEKVTEGRTAQKVVSQVPSRREMACKVVRDLAGRLEAGDLFTLVAFDHRAHVLARAISPSDSAALQQTVKQLATIGGGDTALSLGLQTLEQILRETPENQHLRKLVLLTDGEDQAPQQALEQARILGADLHVPIVAFGVGESKAAFLSEMARTTLAGAFNHIRHEAEAEQFFHQVLTGLKNVQATGVSLKLWLSPEVHVRELYRTRPEVLFVGDMQPDAQNQVILPLEQMERGRAYEFLFRCTLPPKAAGQRLRLAKTSLTFDLCAAGATRQTVETNVVVQYTDDPQLLEQRSGDVKRVLARAEVQRQVLFLQGRIDALRAGQGSERDRTVVANLLKALIAKFQDFGDHAQANQYRAMEKEFQAKGVISQELLNRSLAASSRAEDLIVAQDIDF